MTWSHTTTPEAVARRAGGHRRYLALQRERAALRRARVAGLLRRYGFTHGAFARIAREVGVAKSTITRDVRKILVDMAPCGACGR